MNFLPLLVIPLLLRSSTIERIQKAKDELASQKQEFDKQKAEYNEMIRIRNEQLQQQLADIENVKLEYLRIKEEFLNYIKEEIKKVKTISQRTNIEQRINTNIRTREELTAELDSYVKSISQKSKTKEIDFSL